MPGHPSACPVECANCILHICIRVTLTGVLLESVLCVSLLLSSMFSSCGGEGCIGVCGAWDALTARGTARKAMPQHTVTAVCVIYHRLLLGMVCDRVAVIFV